MDKNPNLWGWQVVSLTKQRESTPVHALCSKGWKTSVKAEYVLIFHLLYLLRGRQGHTLLGEAKRDGTSPAVPFASGRILRRGRGARSRYSEVSWFAGR